MSEQSPHPLSERFHTKWCSGVAVDAVGGRGRVGSKRAPGGAAGSFALPRRTVVRLIGLAALAALATLAVGVAPVWRARAAGTSRAEGSSRTTLRLVDERADETAEDGK